MAGDGVPYKSFVVHHSLSLWWQGGLFRLGERYRGKRVFSPYWFLLPENKTFFFSLLSTICQVRGITTVHSRAVRRKNKISNWNFQNKRKEEETKKKQEKKVCVVVVFLFMTRVKVAQISSLFFTPSLMSWLRVNFILLFVSFLVPVVLLLFVYFLFSLNSFS